MLTSEENLLKNMFHFDFDHIKIKKFQQYVNGSLFTILKVNWDLSLSGVILTVFYQMKITDPRSINKRKKYGIEIIFKITNLCEIIYDKKNPDLRITLDSEQYFKDIENRAVEKEIGLSYDHDPDQSYYEKLLIIQKYNPSLFM